MNKTSEEQFEILISKLKRTNKSCNAENNSTIDHNLSNVRCFPSHVEISLKNGRVLELNGFYLKIDNCEIILDSILKVSWITPDDNHLSKIRLKIDNKFDCIYLHTSKGTFSVEGMGQSVFPVMSFIKWIIAQPD
ncbi:MAG: hypothetical protein AAF383_18885 [Cyanobacteria bacterium P01_A01_bin.83]